MKNPFGKKENDDEVDTGCEYDPQTDSTSCDYNDKTTSVTKQYAKGTDKRPVVTKRRIKTDKAHLDEALQVADKLQ